jgi:hypothetical protein
MTMAFQPSDRVHGATFEHTMGAGSGGNGIRDPPDSGPLSTIAEASTPLPVSDQTRPTARLDCPALSFIQQASKACGDDGVQQLRIAIANIFTR